MFLLYVFPSQTSNSKYYFVMSLTYSCIIRKLAARAALLLLLTLFLSRLPVVFQLSTFEFPPAKAQAQTNLTKIAYPYIYINYIYHLLKINFPPPGGFRPLRLHSLYFIHYRTDLACPVKRVSLDLFRFKIRVFFSILP